MYLAQLSSKKLLPIFSSQIRGKKFHPVWWDPHSLNDYDNLSKGHPSVQEQWDSEWASTEIVPRELKAFDINRLPNNLIARNKRIPVPVLHDNEKTLFYQRRLFGIYGLKSGVNPCEMFDSYEELEREEKLKKLIEPDVEEFKRTRAQEIEEEAKADSERIRKVKENLERLPEMMKKYQASQAKKFEAAKAMDEKRRQLLEDARDKFGYYVDHRDQKFLKMVEEKQEEEKLAKKATKKKK
ncbi:unnamed protein product [Rodentolepis nana]|uniref:Large ribosomal subunit protein mL64 n=1 Tax=Rodentolepis nana TaxID=102285 RepID=A0A0R3TPI0_RODNA|nr:unnamed protein product [Rodentolepis nana]